MRSFKPYRLLVEGFLLSRPPNDDCGQEIPLNPVFPNQELGRYHV